MKKYPASMIIAHWLTVILLIVNAYMGLKLEELEKTRGLTPETFGNFKTHALIGALILLITLFRMFIKRKNAGRLPQLQYYSEGHKKIVNTVHALMYLLLILIPIVGMLNMYQAGVFGVCFGKEFPENATLSHTLHEIHELLVKLLLVLVIAHVAGVIRYILKTKENIFKRMCLLAK